MLSLVYFPSKCVWKVCFPILLAKGEIPAQGPCPPSRWLPLTKKIEQEGPSSPLEPSEGAFELTHGSACIIGWLSGLPDSLISTYIAQFMGRVIGRIHTALRSYSVLDILLPSIIIIVQNYSQALN